MQPESPEQFTVRAAPAFAAPRDVTILTVPGLDGSGPRHWQTLWEQLPFVARADLGDWTRPTLHGWVAALDRTVRDAGAPVVLAAHSLGCLAVAWWAAQCGAEAAGLVRGALLVAPPDVDADWIEPRLRDFRPMPRTRLPFRTRLVASRNDPYAELRAAERMARAWGAELVDVGLSGHVNAESGLAEWPRGLRLLADLAGTDGDRMVTELAIRRALD